MSAPAELSVGRAVDWRFAVTVGTRLARPGPPCTGYTRRQVIAELDTAAQTAAPLVTEVTGLTPVTATPDTEVVDRPGWIASAADSMRVMTGGADTARGYVSGHLAGAQTGAVLAFVASGILGQYDPLAADGAGRLLLVYPNVIAVERQLRVDPHDFRLWVCLHEVTHRVQFTAHPWLVDHMAAALAVLTTDGGDQLTAVLGRLAEFTRARRAGTDPNTAGVLGLVRALQSEPQRRALDELLVLGTLLEGHADHVMDAVGPRAVGSVATIRRRFDQRRHRRQPPLARLVRALLGIDAKLTQYTRGKAFVDAVVERVGMARFNTVWTSPQTLPRPDEIDTPARWIDRVL
ncbi:zinc-dependent metalloprotease [Mycolicibacillus parakoreensis]|uniref:Zinc-dependent metalloprotease n=1 Tax=Mycolicibacillus parakoreensis TaxID=1069221 RepID=A0ABY3TZG9_9MYCO|nr:zinc-dependent metalloprotease [Mycolicibacillus parakoreensis]MCV7314547.1 zinc-dependent metalloprotease [Mycolicibacillus parakoreensis]ULN53122.1 zinc-dependent metalloprotease [Mycolicibacillus parakoreensis]HLS00115.1 zinc-dependent metalloprotease [Mycolicibacillus parakoreensis]